MQDGLETSFFEQALHKNFLQVNPMPQEKHPNPPLDQAVL